MPVIEDGEMEAGNASSGGGEGGGLFASVDGRNLDRETVEAVETRKNRNAVVLAFPPGASPTETTPSGPGS